MANKTLSVTNPSSVGTEAALDAVITSGATTPSEAIFLNNIVETAPETINGSGLTLDGDGFTLTGSATTPALVVASNAEVFLGDLNINDGGAGAISIGVGGLVTFLPSSAPPAGTTNLGIIAGAISGAGGIVVGASGDTAPADVPLVLNGANTYTGATTIYDALDLGNNGSIAGSSSVTLGSSFAVLDVSGAQTAAGAPTTVTVNNLAGGAGTHVYLGLNGLNVVESASASFGGVIADSAAANNYVTAGKVSFTEATGDTYTLTGVQTYTGSTKIMAGTLALTGSASISASANVSLKASGATLDLSGLTGPAVTLNELTGVAGTLVKLGANDLTVDEDVTAASFSGVISGTGTLTLEGPDELSLAGANTYTGVTTIDSGATLGISGAGSLATSEVTGAGAFDISGATGPVTITDLETSGKVTLGAQTLIFAGEDGSLGGVISGTGAVQVGTAAATAAEVDTDAANTYTGATKIYGELILGADGSIADSSNVSLKVSGAELTTDGAQSINELTGVAGTTVDLGGDLTITEDVAAASFGGVISGGYSVELAASTTGATYGLTFTAAQTYTGSTFIDPGATLGLSGAGSISASGEVIDDGVLNISGANPGEMTLIEFNGTGSLVLGANSVLLDESGFQTFSGVISGSGGIELGDENFYLSANQTYTGVTQIDTGAGLYLDGAMATSAYVDNGYLEFGYDEAGTYTISKVISGSGNMEVGYSNPDLPAVSVTLTVADTYTGETYVEYNGTLILSGAGSIADSSYVNNGGIINISAATGPVTFLGYDDYFGATPASLILGGTSLIIGGGTAESDIYGSISGTGSVEIAGPVADYTGVFSPLTYTGATKIYGALYLGTNGTTGSIADSSNVSLKASGALFDISGVTETQTAPVVSINTLTGVAGTTVNLGGNTLDITQNTTATFSGVIEGTNHDGSGLIIDGSSYLTLAGVNTLQGSITIDKGAGLALSGAGSFADLEAGVTDNGVLNIAGATSNSLALVPPPAVVALDQFSGAGSLILGANTANFDGDSYSYFTGSISGTGGIEVSGATGIDIGGSNTYTGLTTVNDDADLDLGSALASSGIVLTTANSELEIGDGAEATLTISQVISGAGYVEFDEGDDGLNGDDVPFTGTLTAASTYTGETYVYEYNTLVLKGSGSIADTSEVYNDGGTVDISQATSPVILNDYEDADSSTAKLLLGGTTVIFEGTSGYTGFDGGVISGTGSVQIGSSTDTTMAVMEFGGPMAYTGSTVIYGQLEVEDTGSIASSSNVALKVSGAELSFDVDAATVDINTLSGVAGTIIYLDDAVLDITQDTTATFSGVIEEGGLTIDAASTAALTLAGVNTYTGVTTDNGSLILGVANAIADSSAVIVNGTLTLGVASTVHDLSGASTGTINLGSYALTDVLSGVTHYTYAGAITGSGSLTETGGFGANTEESTPVTASTLTTSLLTLSHAGSTFTGGVTIEGGTVEVSAVGAAGTGAITFADVSTSTAADAGILQIDNSALTGAGTATESFANTIAGVSAQDVIDLSGLTYDNVPGPAVGGSLSFHNGQLFVTEGNVTVALTIAGLNATTAANYHVYEDAHGGTFLTQLVSTDATHYHP